MVAAATLTGARPLKRFLITAAVVAVVAAGAAAASPTVRFLAANLITGRGGSPVAGGPQMDVAAPDTRLKIWRRAVAMIADAPISGVGLGNFRTVFESDDYNFDSSDDGRRGMHAHNLWLHRTAELGIPGGLCYLAIWAAPLWLLTARARFALPVVRVVSRLPAPPPPNSPTTCLTESWASESIC